MTKEQLIKKHLEGWNGLQQASIQHFSETGTASGSFFMALKAMMDEHAENVVKNISSNTMLADENCVHPFDNVATLGTSICCFKCGKKLR